MTEEDEKLVKILLKEKADLSCKIAKDLIRLKEIEVLLSLIKDKICK